MQVSSPSNTPESAPESAGSTLRFDALALVDGLKLGIGDAGFVSCTPIQAESLPLALTGRDVAGQAQTGTGKTAAYLIALFQLLSTREPLKTKESGPRALILAPTRELAVQIHKDAEQLGSHLGFRLGLAFGGTDYDKQRDTLAAGVDVLIGTPGRTIDFFKQGVFGLKGVQVIVLDEADRMFDLGFIRDIRYVLRRLPDREHRMNLLFSATLSHRVLELAYEHMNDPELVRVEPDKRTADKVRQCIYFPANEEKVALLIMLLKQMDARRTMVFVNTKREAEYLCAQLTANDIKASAISGDVPQRKRLRMLSDFLEGSLPVLIGTDVASRGLHVPDVSHVFNYDLPQDPEDYVHRIGRTARAGASGDAISFGCENYAIYLPEVEGFIGHKIPVEEIDREALDAARAELVVVQRQPRKRHPDGKRDRGRPSQRRGDSKSKRNNERRADGDSPRRNSGSSSGSGSSSSSGSGSSSGADSGSGAKKKRRRRRRRSQKSE